MSPFLVAIVISILNMFMEGMIIKPIIYRGRAEDEDRRRGLREQSSQPRRSLCP